MSVFASDSFAGCRLSVVTRALAARGVSLLAALALCVTAAPLFAQAPIGSAAAAETLFREGRALMAEARYAEACEKFRESQNQDPGAGTLLNLAACLAKAGKSAGAWAAYTEAAASADRSGRQDWARDAREKADALEPTLPRLTVSTTADGVPAGVELARDGSAVGRAQWGVAIPVDAGLHTIRATARGYLPWETTVDVQDGARVTVRVPSLAVEPAASIPATDAPRSTPRGRVEHRRSRFQRSPLAGWASWHLGSARCSVSSPKETRTMATHSAPRYPRARRRGEPLFPPRERTRRGPRSDLLQADPAHRRRGSLLDGSELCFEQTRF